ncbi:tafazzin [Histoplasma capsulatum G186AR]|uniref:Tafazzin family protein n=2 Tax=Ajellomyces capsulatus TaxID=5037 RepID=C0ND77_AJECG|nr:tafazzin [Histoplasma capsulatum G186AR]EEH11618.1 tafazzin [Histoplasma capsulatum G186AR]KAG5302541.1 tafazzin [Histoplasma capsulatum]QSS72059.1 tafazzin [Histoplasma capsulatum G186AR]
MHLSPGTLEHPSSFWKGCSAATMYMVVAACRAFLYTANNTEVHGLEKFLKLLESRADLESRTRGLITVSNHISVMDDPLMWGTIPLLNSRAFQSSNRRWAFGSHDICFSNRAVSAFFTLGQVLPTHRSLHSSYGGLFQPTMTQAIRLLSRGPFSPEPYMAPASRQYWSLQNVCVDPFSEVATAYTTTGEDSHLAPSAYACNSYSWIHIFPEGKVHQAPNKTMRYFKWGVSRLILEASECPDVVPMWIEGTDQVMHEDRTFPRFLPRVNKNISVTFGDPVDLEERFGDLRRRWQHIRAKAEGGQDVLPLGVLNDELKYSKEAIELRIECAKRIRDLVLAVRKSRGLPDEDPKESRVETWLREGPKIEGKMDDGSWIRDA